MSLITDITRRRFLEGAGVAALAGAVGTDASDDTVIEILVESASRYIDRETGRRFYIDSTDADYYYTAREEDNIIVPDFASVTTLSVDLNTLLTK